ncbi:MAG TPA: hypothetical protein VFW19_13445 [Allosphingosinicella sp.]|nr:hypothetical protein [Allosphingosinicella sp.]
MKAAQALVLLAVLSAAASAAPPPKPRARPDPETILRRLGAQVARAIDTDTCFPASAEEYEALGKNAIVMLKSSSAISTELPLKAVYIMHRGVRIPLQRVALLDKQIDAATSRTIQVSFYLVPIHFMKVDADVLADFSGERKAFGFMHFSAKEGMGPNAPAFARVDEYDNPMDADPAIVRKVLAREYPDYFR